MREHPIPQDIVGYKFHIVGNMTIKQFAEVAVGVFVAFLFYQTNLVAFIKWPLIGLSFASGAMLAFVPFEERPLDHWFFTFINVLYKPTKYFWERQAKVPDPFLYKPTGPTTTADQEIDLSPARRQRIKEYLASVHSGTAVDQEELLRQQMINQILQTFDQVHAVPQNVRPDTSHKPNLKVRVRSLGYTAAPTALGAEIVEEEVVDQYQDLQRTSIELRAPLPVSQVATDINVPTLETVEISSPIDEEAVVINNFVDTQGDMAYVENVAADQIDPLAAQAVTFNQNLPFPSKPTQPNKLVGMILTPHHELVNDAIIEIKNETGATVRAVKSNALGQFFITTPLPDGTYMIEVEHPQLSFVPISLSLTGELVDPIEVRSVV